MSEFRFERLARDGAARTGVIHTPRGEIRTPAFMPVGTAAHRQGDAAAKACARPAPTSFWATPIT